MYKSNQINLHGLSKHPLYPTWNGMIGRCFNELQTSYKYYGGIGITVCERWKDIHNFIEDMYPSYQQGLTIDRINGTGNYEPSNCRWTTKSSQARNTKKIRQTNTSGYRGVSLNKKSNKWVSNLKVNYKSKHLGYFDTAIEAAKAYDTYVIENNLEHTINGVLNSQIADISAQKKEVR